jgi:predicted ATPase
MRCPSCGGDHPAGTKFCIECGIALRARCPQCGADTLPGAKFCGECGMPLSEQTPAPPPAPPPSPLRYTPGYLADKILTSRSALEGERKQVTVLFADLKGSMELLADRDPEEARQLLDPVLERMMDAVHRYEGTVNQVLGDGIMALFGAPIAHEDHALRACYAALAMQESISALLALLDVLPADSPFLALDPPQRRQRTLAALKRVLLRESQVQPLLLVFEDLHWIDAETQALLDSLVESLPTGQILLLVNYRPEYQHSWGNKTSYTQLGLDPLPPASAEAMLQSLLGDDAGLEPLKARLIARTQGNPFFLEESVRTLVETQVLVGERGAYRLAKALPSLQVPATVQGVLAARIDRLPPEEKQLLQTAAVIGTEVPLALLQAMVEASEAPLRLGLTHLQAAEFLYATRLFPELEYMFKHALTHEVAYGSLLQERRRALHARIVDAIERLYSDRLDEQVERLAHHAVCGEVWEKAETYCRRAGERAYDRAAVRMLERGLALGRASGNTTWSRIVAGSLGEAYAHAGRLAEGLALLEQLCRDDLRAGALFSYGINVRRLSAGYLRTGRVDEARQHADQALDLARQQKARGHEALALFQLGAVHAHADPPDVAQAEVHYQQALALAEELGMRPLQAHCQLGLGMLWAKLGRREQARAELSGAIELYHTMEMTFWLAQAQAALAQVEGR